MSYRVLGHEGAKPPKITLYDKSGIMPGGCVLQGYFVKYYVLYHDPTIHNTQYKNNPINQYKNNPV
jgi:hypothetical protein